MSGAERRAAPRVAIALPVYVLTEAGAMLPAVLDDLSATGLRLSVDMHVPVDGVVTLRMNILNGRCEATGKVVRVAEDARSIGIAFSEANDQMRQFTADLMTLPAADRKLFLERILDPRIQISAK